MNTDPRRIGLAGRQRDEDAVGHVSHTLSSYGQASESVNGLSCAGSIAISTEGTKQPTHATPAYLRRVVERVFDVNGRLCAPAQPGFQGISRRRQHAARNRAPESVGGVAPRLGRDGDELADVVSVYVPTALSSTDASVTITVASSGTTGHQIWRRTDRLGPVQISSGADIDGDELADFAIGAFRANDGAGRVSVVSGADGHNIYVRDGAEPGLGFGVTLQLGPDITGDGFADLLVAGPYTAVPPGVPYPWGMLGLYSGATGAVIREWPACSGCFVGQVRLLANPMGGALVASVQDGLLKIGSPGEPPSRLLEFSNEFRDLSSPVGDDYDGDGEQDLLLCAAGPPPITCNVVSSRTGFVLMSYMNLSALGPDADGDGLGDLIELGVDRSAIVAVPSARVTCDLSGVSAVQLGPDADGDGLGDVVVRLPPDFQRIGLLLSSRDWGGCE